MTKVWLQNDIFRHHGDQTSHKIEPFLLLFVTFSNISFIVSTKVVMKVMRVPKEKP